MMNCEQFELRLDDYLEGDLFPAELKEAQAHVDQCPACRSKVEQAEAIQTALKQLPAAGMRPGFAREAIAKATGRAEKKHHRRGFVAGFSTALAASVALMAVVTLLPNSMPENNDIAIAQVAISLEQTQTVNLVFDSTSALEQATLTIILPDNVEVPGLPGQHTLTWQTKLVAGKNILPLPLKALSRRSGELLARIEQDGKTKSIRIHLNVENPTPPQAMLPAQHSA